MDDGFKEIIEKLARLEVKIDDLTRIRDRVDIHSKEITELKSFKENQQKYNEKIDKMEKEINDIKKENAETKTENKQVIEELDNIKDNNKWLWRTVVASVIAAGIGIVVVFIKLGMGIQ